MDQHELEGRYTRLKQELAKAYACSTWDSPHIDRLARGLFEIDRVARYRETDALMRAKRQLSRRLICAGDIAIPELRETC